MKLAAASLPLNYLMRDLNDGGTEIDNKNLYSEEDVRGLLKIFIKDMTRSKLEKLFRDLKKTEPFSLYQNILKEFEKECLA